MKDLRTTRTNACYNARIKYYPNEPEPVEMLVADWDIFNPEHIEACDELDSVVLPDLAQKREKGKDAPKIADHGGSIQSWNRARKRAYDLIRCNPSFDMFVTLTFDPEVIDRKSYTEIVHTINTWLDNRVRRKGLKYILCPEYHKDGEGIHFHGLANEDSLKLVRAERDGRVIRRKGKTVYNIDDFPFGFTTAIRVTGDEASKACAGYIFKYMTKQSKQRIGGRYFLSGGDLVKPIYIYANIDYNSVEGDKFALQGMGGACKCIKGDALKSLLEGEIAPVSTSQELS